MNFIITTLFIASCIIAVANCGDYYRIDGRTYFSSYPEATNWYQAKRFCTLLGTQLVDVPNEDENNRILSVINQTETRYNIGLSDWWTSGTDQGSENDFYWDTTGNAFDYTYWLKGEPNNKGTLGSEHCVHYAGYAVNHYWNDRNCALDQYFICRDPVVVSRCSQQDNCCPF